MAHVNGLKMQTKPKNIFFLIYDNYSGAGIDHTQTNGGPYLSLLLFASELGNENLRS